MTQIDFYILSQDQQRARFACRLTEKAYQLGHRIYIHTSGEEQSRAIDELLWTFQSGSFIPHERYNEMSVPQSPVLIGHKEPASTEGEVLINISDTLPVFHARFLRVAEIVDCDEESKLKGRERFRYYRDRGYPLESHRIETNLLGSTE